MCFQARRESRREAAAGESAGILRSTVEGSSRQRPSPGVLSYVVAFACFWTLGACLCLSSPEVVLSSLVPFF